LGRPDPVPGLAGGRLSEGSVNLDGALPRSRKSPLTAETFGNG
jgi:hypothetical protein